MLNEKKSVILIAGDDRAGRLLLREALERDGYEVVEAGDGVQAVEMFKDYGPQIVVLEIVMPRMDGIGACARIRELPGGGCVPVLMICVPEDDESVQRAFETGADEFISKPVNTALLRHRVRLLLKAKLTEEALALQEKKLRSITTSLGEGVYVLDPDGRLTFMNPEAERLLGVCGEELKGRVIHQLIHGSRHDGTMLPAGDCLTLQTLSTGKVYQSENEAYTRQDGTIFPVAVVSAPIIENGEITGCVVTFRDITRRRMMEQELLRAKAEAEIGLTRLREVLSSMQQGVIFVDTEDNIIEINQFASQLAGRSREEMLNRSLWDFYNGDQGERLRMVLDEYKTGPNRAPTPLYNWTGRGEITVTVQPVMKEEHYLGALLCAIDLSPLMEARRALEIGKCLQDKILQTAATAIYIVNSYGEIVNVNDEFYSITGFQKEEILGRHNLMLKSKCMEKCTMYDDSRTEPILKHQCTITNKDGKLLSILKNINILRDDAGRFTGAIISFIDISKIVEAKEEAEKARERAEYLASVDYLTGLLNRRVFMERLDQEMERCKREGTSLGIILADIDHFKKVNDTYGHQAGDVVLQVFASRLSGFSRTYDIVGRYGGEEFITCFVGTNCEQAERIAERMRVAVEEQCIPLPGVPVCINITSSFGVACTEPGIETNVDTLIARADEALYRAKAEGRNRVCLAV